MGPPRGSWQREDIAGFGWSLLLHAVLLAPWTIPSCAAHRDQAKPIEVTFMVTPADTGSQDWTWKSHHPPSGNGPCDGDDIAPEWYDFDLAAGPLDRAFIAAAHQSHYGVVIGEELIRGRTSRALRGRLHAVDAVRLLAGDAGLCVEEDDNPDGDTLVLIKCERGQAPLSRAMLPALAIGKNQTPKSPCRSAMLPDHVRFGPSAAATVIT